MQDSVITADSNSKLRCAILKALSYAAVFNYPLKPSEIIQGMEEMEEDIQSVRQILDQLESEKIIFQYHGFYGLKDDIQFEKRLDRNERAQKYLPLAKRISKFIGGFPFVRAVFLSGSISKNSMDEDSDIDFFVITEPGKLWITRTLLVLFKKVFLFNSYRFFCVNYFIDRDHMKIEAEDLYTAHEIITLIPTYGKNDCDRFFESNPWVHQFLPNGSMPETSQVPIARRTLMKKVFEFVLDQPFGNRAELWTRKMTQRYWEKKYAHLNRVDFEKTQVSTEGQSTYHPENFKYKVMDKMHLIQEDLEPYMRLQEI